ncbi:MAG: kynureninase [Flavobacteriales bacterium]|nr:kynureninase [Flavobacteriales bacterium]
MSTSVNKEPVITSTNFEFSADFAAAQDNADPLSRFREQMLFPKVRGKEALYFVGNSLGLQPRSASQAVNDEMQRWAEMGVEGYTRGDAPWFDLHKRFAKGLALYTGARESEVCVMGSLTGNLHAMLTSFFTPNGKRNKIIMEAGAFSSDYYALSSQLKLHGLDVGSCLIELFPAEGEATLQPQAIIEAINATGDELALVMMGGVNYYTGQRYDMEAITRAAHGVGAKAGFDLAHAIGNIELNLHDWDVDFAVWCHYKYLNAGPGAIAGFFVNERYASKPGLPRLEGWWGCDPAERFKMKKEFTPTPGAAGWMMSCLPAVAMAPQQAALEQMVDAGPENLFLKRDKLTAYLWYCLKEVEASTGVEVKILTPEDPAMRGAQLSVVIDRGKEVFDQLYDLGVICDWREPEVIRLAPVPLYNSYTDVYLFSKILRDILFKR